MGDILTNTSPNSLRERGAHPNSEKQEIRVCRPQSIVWQRRRCYSSRNANETPLLLRYADRRLADLDGYSIRLWAGLWWIRQVLSRQAKRSSANRTHCRQMEL